MPKSLTPPPPKKQCNSVLEPPSAAQILQSTPLENTMPQRRHISRSTLALILVLVAWFFPVVASADKSDSFTTHEQRTTLPEIDDIRELPVLAPGLKKGTIAIAFPDQLHPTQPQTGFKELKKYKIPFVEDFLKQTKSRYSKDLFKALLKHQSISPVYLHAPLRGDSRYDKMDILGWVTDRTHGSDAQSQVYEEVYGKKSLRRLLYDKKGRPLNFILVQVMDDVSAMSDAQFTQFMVEENHSYLSYFSRRKDGGTSVRKISFRDLPEKVYETTDNPYRGLVGVLQRKDDLGRSPSDFSQFVIARALAKLGTVKWDEISQEASKKDYKKARKAAVEFLSSPAAKDLPGVEALQDADLNDESIDSPSSGPSCKILLEK
jgi:hypothetical protein